jgi:S1-C subfamily serine protease
MTGPKHLWSGDWEHESAHAADELAYRLPPQPEVPTADEPEPTRQRRWRRLLGVRQLSAVLAVLVLAGVAVAIATNSGGGSPSAPKAAVSGPSASWMGMQIVNTPLGAAVSTVPNGSEGDAVGFEPGDVITQIGNASVDSPKQIQTAVANIPLGQQIRIAISRGSSILTATVTLRDRPTIQP